MLVLKYPDAEEPLTINNTCVRRSVDLEPGDQRTLLRIAREDLAAKTRVLTASRWLSNRYDFDEGRAQLRDTARHDCPEPPRPIQEQRIQAFLSKRGVSVKASCALWLAWHQNDWREIESVLNEPVARDWSAFVTTRAGEILIKHKRDPNHPLAQIVQRHRHSWDAWIRTQASATRDPLCHPASSLYHFIAAHSIRYPEMPQGFSVADPPPWVGGQLKAAWIEEYNLLQRGRICVGCGRRGIDLTECEVCGRPFHPTCGCQCRRACVRCHAEESGILRTPCQYGRSPIYACVVCGSAGHLDTEPWDGGMARCPGCKSFYHTGPCACECGRRCANCHPGSFAKQAHNSLSYPPYDDDGVVEEPVVYAPTPTISDFLGILVHLRGGIVTLAGKLFTGLAHSRLDKRAERWRGPGTCPMGGKETRRLAHKAGPTRTTHHEEEARNHYGEHGEEELH